ncbi:alkylmercury lyase family protein [Geomonas sp. RF6]|uniref:organomercurial lyase n=1 Tax=Geomonas sp. RF6 TaxID=2897342 RepID=UPI001E2C6C1A|nr:organomercurial lyase [Geomonas sp. RF6]UFS72068.1 alkylmercury lyase family protein [Geomonas sp. RF6]
MNDFERHVRAYVIQTLRDTSVAPSAATIASALGSSEGDVCLALQRLADEHRLVLLPGTESVWMAHPFSAIPTDFLVRIGDRSWYANCVWDGLSILALMGDGVLETHSPATGEPMRFSVTEGRVEGEGLVHFLVPAKAFWEDIAFT